MSKKHKRNRGNWNGEEQKETTMEQPGVETAAKPAEVADDNLEGLLPGGEGDGSLPGGGEDEQGAPAPEAPAEPEAPTVPAGQEPVQPTTIEPKEPAAPPQPAVAKEKLMSEDIIKKSAPQGNAFARRRAAAAASIHHTPTGLKVQKMFEAYNARMATKSNDREENMARIRMLQQILNAACPNLQLDLQTATDVVRVVFDNFMKGWGTLYNDRNIFRMGDTLKGSAYDLDKLTLFFEAFVQMVEGAQDKKKVLFDDARIGKVLRNPNIVIAMGRIRDNINTVNGFGPRT